MALMKCPDCASDISTEAPACPKCGRPNAKPNVTGGSATTDGSISPAEWRKQMYGGREATGASRSTMSDAQWTAWMESRKKSGWIAALLNIFLPGAGYFYCGRYLLGVLAFVLVALMWVAAFAVWAIFGVFAWGGITLVLVIDGFLCARRYNRKLIEQELGQ